MRMRFFDTHAHLDSEDFRNDLSGVVGRAKAAGVHGIVVVGTSAEASARCIEVATQFGLLAAVGIQPNHVSEAVAGDWERIVPLADHPAVAALGETGLDRYWDRAPFELQQDYFDRHLRLSQATGLPFIVHMRECGDDITRMLIEARKRGPLRGVMHSFTGDQALAETCLELGMHISFAGMVTYKKSDELRDVAKTIPDDRILIETDAPYLSPHPHRNVRPNEPRLVVDTATCLAEARGVDLKSFAEQTWQNAESLFRRQSP